MNIYIGNMSSETTEDQIRQAFEGYGKVSSVKIIMDRDSGLSRGFGFIDMPTEDEAIAAIKGLHEKDMGGQLINVNKAKPRAEG